MMASNGQARKEALDFLIGELSEIRGMGKIPENEVELWMRQEGLTLKEDQGDYWGYLPQSCRWIAFGEMVGRLEKHALCHCPQVQIISGRRGFPSVPAPAIETGGLDETPGVPMFSKDRLASPSSKLKKAARALAFGAVGLISFVGGAGLYLGVVQDYIHSSKEIEEEAISCPARGGKDLPEQLSTEAVGLETKMAVLRGNAERLTAEKERCYSEKEEAQGDYLACAYDLIDFELASAESSSALEQCNSAAKQGREDYAGLERRLEEFSRESRAKTDFLVNQSSSWYSGFSAMVALWLDAEGRYADALQAGKICEISWEDDQKEHLAQLREWDVVYKDRKKAETELAEVKSALAEEKKARIVLTQALAQAAEANAYQAEQFSGSALAADSRVVDNAGKACISALEEIWRESYEQKKRAEEGVDERDSDRLIRENEMGIALTYVDNGLAAEKERDSAVIELGECFAENGAITGRNAELARLYEISLVLANGALADLIQTEESLARKTAEYSNLEFSHQDELERKRDEFTRLQGELAQLQGRLAQVQGQLKIAEESNSSYSLENDKNRSDSIACREEQDRMRQESSRIGGLLKEKTEESASYARERDDCRKQVKSLGSELEVCLSERELALAVRTDYQTATPETAVFSRRQDSRRQETETSSRLRKPAERYSSFESDAPVLETSYYGQLVAGWLVADHARAEEIALAYVEEHGGSVTVCGRSNRDKAESFYEQIAPEGRDDVYTLEFFVKSTGEFYEEMDSKTPNCVPLTVIEE